MNQPVQSLYVHVPFCARKCSYCAFYSEPSDGRTMNRYVDCLISEMDRLPKDFRPKTVFFGGGTPSILTIPQWRRMLEAMGQRDLLGCAEFTVECNPATVSLEKAQVLRGFGVNRISMGVQSLDEDLLDRLGRVHSRDMVFRSFDVLRKAGFDNVNLDLMFAIPGQTIKMWRETLQEAIALGSEHISTYEVIYEDDTPLFKEREAGKIQEDEDLACSMYEELVTAVSTAGFRQYEVANFARKKDSARMCADAPFYACWHNLNYWRGGQFYGVGPSATSYVGGVRAKNISNTQLYCQRVEAGQSAAETSEELSPEARAGETAAFGLRMTEGWSFELFRTVTGYDLREGWLEEMQSLEQRGLAVLEPHGFRLTPRGLRFADMAAELFLR